jgi:phage/conjugal plasmid C-4 type zinc finger TraR family protein
MADEADRAAEYEERHRDAAIMAARGYAAHAVPQPDDHRYCDDCGISIPDARIRLIPWAKRCVDCQGLAEEVV